MGRAIWAVIGIILLIAGIVYAVAPSIVERFSIGFGLEAKTRLYLGAGLVVLGLIFIVLKFKR